MGDIGALALGAALGVVAVLARQELVLLIMGGVFVIETMSVILQVGSYKLTGKRIFKMAPLHHHFELKGWPEPRVIVRFWVITVILVLIWSGDVEDSLSMEVKEKRRQTAKADDVSVRARSQSARFAPARSGVDNAGGRAWSHRYFLRALLTCSKREHGAERQP